MSLGIGIYQLSQPHVLTGVLGYNEGYDDGVYLGVATRLVHGVLPYRDFVFVHPPGIAYLMAPFALLGRAFGTEWALILARCLTVAVVAANAVLAGLLVRPVGRAAVFVASFSLALWPLAVSADRTLQLEPYLVFFCLLGAVLIFQGGDLARRYRLFFGGAALGFACVVQVWGVLPVAAVLVCCAPRWRRGFGTVVLGVAAAGIAFCLPFLLVAPHAFIHEVITAQLQRHVPAGVVATSFRGRLQLMFGIAGITAFTVAGIVVETILVAFAVLVVVMFGIGHRRRTMVEWFVLAALAAVFAGMFETSTFYDHYAYFPAAFFAVLLGVCLGRVASGVATFVSRPTSRWNGASKRVLPVVSVVLSLGVVGVLVQQDVTYSHRYLGEASNDGPPLARVIPPGACVVTDDPVDLLVAGRFSPARSGCPAVIDPYGMYLTDNNGTEPYPLTPTAHYSLAFVQEWFGWLQSADYVVLRTPFSDFIPWTYYEIDWFQQNYRLVTHIQVVYAHGFVDTKKDMYVYKRVSS